MGFYVAFFLKRTNKKVIHPQSRFFESHSTIMVLVVFFFFLQEQTVVLRTVERYKKEKKGGRVKDFMGL
jgi:hypothetical protein